MRLYEFVGDAGNGGGNPRSYQGVVGELLHTAEEHVQVAGRCQKPQKG